MGAQLKFRKILGGPALLNKLARVFCVGNPLLYNRFLMNEQFLISLFVASKSLNDFNT